MSDQYADYPPVIVDKIKKWEEVTGRRHKGSLELSKGKNLIYFDPDFVIAVLKGFDLIIKENDDQLEKLKSLKEMV